MTSPATGVVLSELTTFGVGGRARWYCPVKTPQELVAAVTAARKSRRPYALIAGGSNVVFADRYFPGLIIQFWQPRGRAAVAGRQITGEASLPLGRLVATAIRHGLAGLEALAGIPGSVGGAIVGNAGAYGQSISDHLVDVLIFDGTKERRLTKNQCRFAYRDSIFKTPAGRDWLVLGAQFKLTPAEPKVLRREAKRIIKIRERKYQPGLKCPGSFFKNVLVRDVPRSALRLLDRQKIIDGKIPAGYLLEAVGAKGRRLGGVKIAAFHGNLLINTGRATCGEVRRLAALLKKQVKTRFGIELAEEVRYLP